MTQYYFRLFTLSVVGFFGLTNLAIAGMVEITNEGVEKATQVQPCHISFEMTGDEHNNIHIDIPPVHKSSSESLKNGQYNYISAMAPNYFAECLQGKTIQVNDQTVLKFKVSPESGGVCHMTVEEKK